jgi:ketosteroid isomerase-like protein
MSQHQLRLASTHFYKTFERLDLETMSQLWARNVPVSCVHPGWDLVLGHQAVMESWRAIFEGTTELSFETEDAQVTAGSEMGWVVSRELLRTTVQGMPVENTLTAVNTFVLEEGVWRIAHHHAAPLLAGRPRAPARAKDTVLH